MSAGVIETTALLISLIGMPLEEIDVDAKIDGIVATVTVEHVFANPYDRAIEGVYQFPLPAGAAVHAYQIQIGERTIRGEIRNADEARRAYESARHEGRTAALVEEQKPNVFTQSVANIAPHEPLRVRLTYVEHLAFEDGGYELVYPLVVGPRFTPEETSDPHLTPSARYGESNAKVRIGVRLDAGVPIDAVESPSHRLLQRVLDANARDLSVYDAAPDRDFVLRWKTAGDRDRVGLLTHEGYFTLIVQPKLSYESSEITGREVVFLIDRSGSMSGVPIMHAREIADALVRSMTARDTFEVIAFSDRADACFGHAVPANDANKSRAFAWIDALTSGGGTQLLDGVTRSLLKKPTERRVRQVVVITDGEVGNDDEILNAVAKHAAHNRIFPVGVGAAPNRYLLDRLGSDSRGFASYVAVNESPALAIDRVVRRTNRPYLTGIEIDWNGLGVSDVRPRVLPDVYAGQPLVVSGRFDSIGRAKIHVLGKVAGQAVDLGLDVDLARAEFHPGGPGPAEPDHPSSLASLTARSRLHPGVPKLWARRKIDELLANDALRMDPRTQQEVTAIGLEHAMVTPYTSFVAIDRGRVVSTGAPLLVEQTLDVPANDPAPVYAQQTSEPPRSHRRSYGGGGGGGGDLDPITILTILGSLPVAWQLRRRRT